MTPTDITPHHARTHYLPCLPQIGFYTMIMAVLFSSLFSSHVLAQNEGRWYEVELLVFKRLGQEANPNENWPQNFEMLYPENLQTLKTIGNGSLSKLPRNTHRLDGFHGALKRSQDYRVLLHTAWQQQMFNEEDSPAIMLSGGDLIDHYRELEGSIKIHIGRYLHLTTDLWLSDREIVDDLVWPSLPNKPGTLADYRQYDFNEFPVVSFREKRRMRSTEIHYLDHPLMGLFILFTPISEQPANP